MSPEKGFGIHRDNLIKKIAIHHLPAQWRQVGTLVELEHKINQKKRYARVITCDTTEATLDFNHPFAGKTIICSIHVISVKCLSAVEKDFS